jgi:putative acetyltransferase
MGGLPNVVIRRAEPEDYEGICAAFDAEECYAGTLQTPYPSKDVWRKRLAEFAQTDFMLVACVDGKIVGHAALNVVGKSPRRAHAMHLGMTVNRDFHGQGIGTALMKALLDLADGWLPVFRIELTVFTDNERAIALYRKFGFEVEGTHRSYALRAGQYVDTLSMARLRPKQKI